MRQYQHNLYRWLYGLGGFHFIADIQRDWVGKYRYFLESKEAIPREKSGPIAEKFVSDFIDFLHNNGLKESPEGTWIFRNIVDGTLRWPEDSEKVVELIQDFNKAKKSGNFRAERDLLKYKRFPELWEVVNNYFGKDNGPEPSMDLPGVEYLGAYKNLKLYEINDARSMAEIAKRGSGWCVKDLSYGKEYLEDGPFLLVTKNGKNYVLIHEGSGQAKDVSDDTITNEIAGEIFPLVKSHLRNYRDEIAIFLNYYPEEDQIDIVAEHPRALKYISKPSEKVIRAALESDPYAIRYVDNPSEELQLWIVKRAPEAIGSIRNPTSRVQLIAVEADGGLLVAITHPTEEVQLAAVKDDPYAIRYVENPPTQLQLIAVRGNPYSITGIKNPSEEAQLEAVKADPSLIRDINNPTEKVQLEAVKADPRLILNIQNPTEKVQLEAVRLDKDVIRYIRNPTDRVLEKVGITGTVRNSTIERTTTYVTRKSMSKWLHGSHTNGLVAPRRFLDTHKRPN